MRKNSRLIWKNWACSAPLAECHEESRNIDETDIDIRFIQTSHTEPDTRLSAESYQ